MKDVMIDFEALGKGNNNCICQVGAVYFNNVTGELGEEFKANIDAESHVKLGAELDSSAVYWWLSQSKEAQQSILAEPRENVVRVMTRLNEFLSKATRIWSHATYDFVLLMNTMRQCGIPPSFSHKAGLDIRTLVYLSGTSTSAVPREGLHHDGLEDAKHQVKYTVQALNTIKNNKSVIKFINSVQDK